MNNFKNNFQKELSNPVDLTKSTIKLSDEINKITNKTSDINSNISNDIMLIDRYSHSNDISDLIQLNEYLTQKYRFLIDNSNGELVVVFDDTVQKMTRFEHSIVFSKIKSMLINLIHSNNSNAFANKLLTTFNVAGEHTVTSALKALLK